jgi:hypothetical protein
VTAHTNMSKAEWEQLYWDAWKIYYTYDHIETILRRARVSGVRIYRLMVIVLWFAFSLAIEKVHPLQGGFIRLKHRFDRRSSRPVEPVWKFYPRYGWEIVSKQVKILYRAARLYVMCWQVSRDPNGMTYTDLAMTPVKDDETENLEIFTHNQAARDGVAHAKKVKALTGAG